MSFRDAGLPVMDSTTHIVPLMVGDPVKREAHQRHSARRIWRLCSADQLPHRSARDRNACASPGPAHTEAMMDELTEALCEIWDRLEMRKAA
jgi:5-aminolevulinate synthase